MKLNKLRESLVEIKLLINRSASYVSIGNFIMLVLVFLNTTAWGMFQFLDKKTFVSVGLVSAIIGIIAIGYLDTKLKFWRTETERSYFADRNPTILLFCVLLAQLIMQSGKEGTQLDLQLLEIFKRCKLDEQYQECKKSFKTNDSKI